MMIYIILLLLIIVMLPSHKTIENFTINDIDVSAIKTLSDIAKKLTENGTITIPGGLKLGNTVLNENDFIKIKDYTTNNKLTFGNVLITNTNNNLGELRLSRTDNINSTVINPGDYMVHHNIGGQKGYGWTGMW